MDRARDEEGFTLIELMASIIILVVGITAVSQVFLGTLRANSSADIRSQVTSIAGREVEAIRSQPYAQVGLPSGSVPATWVDPLDSSTYSVVFAAGSSIAPTGSDTTSAKLPVTIQRLVLWVASGANTKAYKRVVALTSWADGAGSHTVRQDSDVYPGGLGPYTGTTTSTSTTSTTTASNPGAPTGLAATQDALNPTHQIDLSWTAGSPVATLWEIQHSLTSDFATFTEDTANQPASPTTYAKSGLAAATTFWFRVRALGPTGAPSAWSPVASAATASAGPTCTIGTSNATPSAQNRANNGNGNLSSSIYVQVHTSGTCSGLTLQFTPSASSGQKSVYLVARSGGVWDYTIGSSDYGWDTGTRSIAVEDPTLTVLATISLTICTKNASHCP